MKILLLNTYDQRGGATKAAVRLTKGLRSLGVDADILVKDQTSSEGFVIGPSSIWTRGIAQMRYYIEKLPVLLYPDRKQSLFSPSIIPDLLDKKVNLLNPDIVHLHWICEGFLQIETIRRFKMPIVWTLHDSWPFTGGCHIPFDCEAYVNECGNCPSLGSRRRFDISHWIWSRKKRAWKDLQMTIVTPSHWLANCVKKSSLMRNYRVEVIPNGLDVQLYRPHNKQIARELLRLPNDKKLMLFGALSSTTDKNKGFHLLAPALKQLSDEGWRDKAELLVFGSSKPSSSDFGFNTRYLGHLYDDISLSLLYSAADVFIAPSISENLPYTVMESMACGTPCVGFHVGGMPDLIEHEQSGYLAVPYEPRDLSKGIKWVLTNENHLLLSKNARRKIENGFSLEAVATRYRDLYEEIIDSSETHIIT